MLVLTAVKKKVHFYRMKAKHSISCAVEALVRRQRQLLPQKPSVLLGETNILDKVI